MMAANMRPAMIVTIDRSTANSFPAASTDCQRRRRTAPSFFPISRKVSKGPGACTPQGGGGVLGHFLRHAPMQSCCDQDAALLSDRCQSVNGIRCLRRLRLMVPVELTAKNSRSLAAEDRYACRS